MIKNRRKNRNWKTVILFVLCLSIIWMLFVLNGGDMSTYVLARLSEEVTSRGRATSIQHAGSRTIDSLDQREGKYESINGKHFKIKFIHLYFGYVL